MRGFLAALVISALLIGGFFSYMGMFSQYEINETNVGPYKFVYEEHVGSYSRVAKTMDDIKTRLSDDGIESEVGMGIYFDNPRYTPMNELRSEVGYVIEKSDYSDFAKVSEDYNVKNIPSKKSMVVKFPLKNSLSYVLGQMKVYPMFEEYTRANNYKYMQESYELYNLKEKSITFVQEIVPLDYMPN